MAMTSIDPCSSVPVYERQGCVKRFILGSVLLNCSVISIRSKSRAGSVMRMADRNREEKIALLERANEKV
jgi:hypothetical protein